MKKLLQKLIIAINMPTNILVATLTNIAKHKTIKLRAQYINVLPIGLSDKRFIKVIGHQNIYDNHQFFFNQDEKDKIIETIKKEYPESIQKTIRLADDICNHIFDLLGSGKVKIGDEIDWHFDFKSGHNWNPKEYYLRTGKYVTLNDSSDVKVPWELSRCQHFVTLGKAYWYTGNEKYTKEFVSQIESWIESNTVELGVNWACTMDVAIRATNWIWGYYFFSESPSLTNEFKIKFKKSLFIHGNHIIHNLEFGSIRGNHYLSDIVGLVYLGIFFQGTKKGKKWLKKGLSALEEEMEFQVHPDGVDFEASISYHRLVTELFISATLLCLKNDIAFPKWYMARLEKMIEFVMYYTKPDGMYPIIGDADDGRLHILANNHINDHRYLLSVGAVLFNRSDFKSTYSIFNEEAFWLLGLEGLNKFKLLTASESKPTSKAFNDGGYYIMRNDDQYMIIRCGDVGLKGHGGHGHCDCLSFELFIGGRSVVIDPGAYIYTAAAAARNRFRSTKYHNTIVVDAEEMNRFEEDQLFSMHFDAVPTLHKWITTEEYDIFDGTHTGYSRMQEAVIHRRQIYFNKNEGYWIIKDILTGEGVHLFEMFLHFSDMNIELNSFNIKTENNVFVKQLNCHNMGVEKQNGWLSPSYGIKYKAPIVKFYKKDRVPVEFITVISQQDISLADTDQIIHEFEEIINT